MFDKHDVVARGKCNLCGSGSSVSILDLGTQHLADTFPVSANVTLKEIPLILNKCVSCGHHYTAYKTDSIERYVNSNYAYTSDNSPVSRAHFTNLAACIAFYAKDIENKRILEIGSNSGYLLQQLQALGFEVFGVDPSPEMCALASRRLPKAKIDCEFFSERYARDSETKYGVIVGTNVLNHIEDLPEVAVALDLLLEDDGIMIFEVPSLELLARDLLFETIYHEHVNYFTLGALCDLFSLVQCKIVKFEYNEYQAGALRIFVAKKSSSKHEAVDSSQSGYESIDLGRLQKLNDILYVIEGRIKNSLLDLRSNPNYVETVAVGAATKGNTFLNTMALTKEYIPVVLESAETKIGRYCSRDMIPIVDEREYQAFSNYLVLPYNIASFVCNLKQYSDRSFFDYRSIIQEVFDSYEN